MSKATEIKTLLNDTFGALDDAQILAITIYGEARGEGREGMIAVGSVILERVEHRGWDGDTIKEVCLMPWQFSCYLPGDPNFISLKLMAQNFDAHYEKSKSLQNCYAVASGLLDGTIERTPEIAAHHVCQYLTVNCDAAWEKKMKKICTIGRHDFYA